MLGTVKGRKTHEWGKEKKMTKTNQAIAPSSTEGTRTKRRPSKKTAQAGKPPVELPSAEGQRLSNGTWNNSFKDAVCDAIYELDLSANLASQHYKDEPSQPSISRWMRQDPRWGGKPKRKRRARTMVKVAGPKVSQAPQSPAALTDLANSVVVLIIPKKDFDLRQIALLTG